MNETKTVILVYVEDLVVDFLYYDRKEDEDLPMGAIEQALASGEITKQEIVDRFDKKLDECLSSTGEKG
jgi:hypothetical protein